MVIKIGTVDDEEISKIIEIIRYEIRKKEYKCDLMDFNKIPLQKNTINIVVLIVKKIIRKIKKYLTRLC